MKVSLKNIIVPSIPMASLLVLFCVVLWFSAYLGNRVFVLPSQQSPTVFDLGSLLAPDSFLSSLVSLAFVLFNAFLMAQINNRFTIIRTRTFMPVLVFLFVMASWGEAHVANSSHLILTLLVLALFSFFSMSRDRKATEPAFLGTLLLSVAGLMTNPLVFLIPVCWIGFMIFQSFSLRTFLASLFGALAPWVIYLAVEYALQGQLDIMQLVFLQPDLSFGWITANELPLLIYSGLFLAFFILGVSGMYLLSHTDAIHTRNKLNFMVLLSVGLVVLAVLYHTQLALFLPLIAFLFSLVFSHPITLKQNNFYGIAFLVFVVVNLAYVVVKLFLF